MGFFQDLHVEIMKILELGPKTESEVEDAFSQLGLANKFNISYEEFLEELIVSHAIWCSATGVYYRLDHVLAGTQLSHRLTEREINYGFMDLVPDLNGISADLSEFVLSNGTKLELVFMGIGDPEVVSETGSLVGPSDWLQQYSPGDVIVVSRHGETFQISRPDSISDGTLELEVLGRAFNRLYDEDGKMGVGIDDLLLEALCDDPLAFKTPAPPMTDLFASLGLELNVVWVGRTGDKWDTPLTSIIEASLEEIFESNEFDDCCIDQFGTVVSAWTSWRAGEADEIDQKAILKALSHENVSLGFSAWCCRFELDDLGQLVEFMTFLTQSKIPEVSMAYYVRSRTHAIEGRAILAEKDLLTALQYDPGNELVKQELANYSADRDDIISYITRLRACRYGDVLNQLEMAEALVPKYQLTERNAPCPCGSGRKYKTCCLIRPKMNTVEVQAWLEFRVTRWMTRPEIRYLVDDLFSEFEIELEDQDLDERHFGFIFDVATFEHGGVSDYLQRRGELLTESDREILQAMTESSRALFEVIELAPGKSITLRDVTTGVLTKVSEMEASTQLSLGDYILSRIVNLPNGPELFGQTFTVALSRRDSLIELLDDGADAFDLVRWYASAVRPPELYNFDNEKLVLCSAKVKVGNLSRLRTSLNKELEISEVDHWRIVEDHPVYDTVSIAMLRIEDGLLVIDTNSLERLDRVLDLLRALVGKLVIIERSEASGDEIMKQIAGSRSQSWNSDVQELESPELPDEVMKALNEHIDGLENKWLDQEIPGLAGLSPRQAATDPTRREDLLRLLNEIERDEQRIGNSGRSGAGFSSERIRAKLNL